jgi:HAD superfamily hydrolase (TIGR01509 family)
MLRAIIFDFDGVLANTEPLHCRAFAEVLGPLGVMPSEAEYFDAFVGLNDRALLEAVFQRAGRAVDGSRLDGLQRQKDTAYFSLIAGGMTLSPGAADFIERAGRRWELGICSGARRREIDTILGAAGLGDVFAVIVTSDEVAESKPHPAGYRRAVRELAKFVSNLRPHETVAIEDSDHGVAAARACGMKTVRLAASPGGGRRVTADLVVPGISAITDERLLSLFG